MTTEEKKIEEAAYVLAKDPNDAMRYSNAIYNACVLMAKSDAAKEYWLQKLSEEFESKSGDETVDMIEIVNKVLKSDMAKEYHSKGMITKEEVLSFFEKYEPNLAVTILKSEFVEWFDKNKTA